MTEKSESKKPAFPVVLPSNWDGVSEGMSKLEYCSVHLMAAMISTQTDFKYLNLHFHAEQAVEAAKILLARLEEEDENQVADGEEDGE